MNEANMLTEIDKNWCNTTHGHFEFYTLGEE